MEYPNAFWQVTLLRRAGIGLAILAAVCATRLPLAPKYLYYFDSVNFALAMERFDPSLHQPQPPGYPLHVLFLRILHLFIPAPEHVLLAGGIIVSVLSIVLIWRLGDALFGPRAGLSAALLLLANPVFWHSALTHPVRLWLAAGSIGFVLACWRVITSRSPARPFLAACATLGIVAGFRPALLLFLLPMLAFTACKARLRPRGIGLGLTVLVCTIAPWTAYTAAASGGLPAYLDLLRGYVAHEFSATSMLYGAESRQASRMFLMAVVWNGLGVMAWIWAPFLSRGLPADRTPWMMIGLWFLPAFLFHAVVHVGDPDHTVITNAALSMAGGAAIAGLAKRLTRTGWWFANGMAMATSVMLFFLPLPGVASAVGFRAIDYVDQAARQTISAIRELRAEGPLTLICYRCFITHRQLQYYFPEIPVLILEGDAFDSAVPPFAWMSDNGVRISPERQGDRLVLPVTGRTVWLISPDDAASRRHLQNQLDVRQRGMVYWKKTVSGEVLRFGQYTFLPALQ